MTAPSPFCAVHPSGTTTVCAPCRDARVRQRDWFESDARDDAQRGVGRKSKDDVATSGQVEPEIRRSVFADVIKVALDDPQVEFVRGFGRKVEHGSVVVQLRRHGRKRIARRALTGVAVAALALWAVAS